MYNVPTHIKTHVDRIIKEYDDMYRQGHKIALQILRGNKLYSGLETTEYYLNAVKNFRRLLSKPEGNLFIGTDSEIQKRIYQQICEFYKPLSPEAICRITREVVCQGQLERAINVARRNSVTSKEAHQISQYITNGRTLNWGDIDETVNRKVFKLVKSEEDFEDLLHRTGKEPITEITQEGSHPYSQIRIAFQVWDIQSLYRKQSRFREFRTFWEAPHVVEEFDLEYTIFNMWNDVTKTGIYYVYIPQFN